MLGLAMEQEEQTRSFGSPQKANAIRRRTKELAKKSETMFMELGKFLYMIWDRTLDGARDGQALYEKWGYNSFSEYVEKELKMGTRRAQRLRKVWYTLEVSCAGIPIDLKMKLIDLGSTKLREMARILNADNAEEWYQKCRDLTVKETSQAVNDYLDEIHGPAAPKDAAIRVQEPIPDEDVGYEFAENFRLYPRQQQNVKDAIEAARHLTTNPSAKKGHCLDLICMDFLASNKFTFGRDDDREAFISRMERNLKLKIIAIDPSTGEIIHGLGTLEALARREIE